jgi:ribosomal protein S18 acetylase RimI-like enzyme
VNAESSTRLRPAGFDATLLARVEDAGLNASAPPQQRLIDGWLVRFSPGKAKRARCVNAVAAGRLPLAEKLRLCEQVYAAAGLPMFVRITPFSEPHGLDLALAGIGMQRIDDTRVMLLPDIPHHEPEALPRDLGLERISHEPFAQAIGVLRGSSLAQRQAHGERLANAPVPFSAWVIRREGQVVACGQLAIEGELVGLYDVFTAPTARGQGLARRLCSHLLAHAAAAGARHAYLQVEGDNHAARAVYHRLGFADGYAYHYRAPAGSAA